MELEPAALQSQSGRKPRDQRKKRNIFDEEPQEGQQSPQKRRDSPDEPTSAPVALDCDDGNQQLQGSPFKLVGSAILAHTGALKERNQQQVRNFVRNQMYYGEDHNDFELVSTSEVSSVTKAQEEGSVDEATTTIPKANTTANRVTVYVGGKPGNEEEKSESLEPTQSSLSKKAATAEKSSSKKRRERGDLFVQVEEAPSEPQPSKPEPSQKPVESEEDYQPTKKKEMRKGSENPPSAPKEQPEVTPPPRVISIDSEQSFKDFFNRPLPKHTLMQCEVRRYSEGLGTRFQLYLDDMRPLMCAIPHSSVTTNYHISMNRETDRNSKYYLGKLRSNFTGSLYSLYNIGENPKKEKDPSKRRSTISNVEYETNFLGLKGPRKLKVRIPNCEQKERFPQTLFQLDDDRDLQYVQGKHHGSVMIYQNKEPRWNEKLKSYALNFGGRVKEASIKNFILVRYDPNSKQKSETNCLIFGKISKDKFDLQFTYPFSPLQAFGIALSAFDTKLNCE